MTHPGETMLKMTNQTPFPQMRNQSGQQFTSIFSVLSSAQILEAPLRHLLTDWLRSPVPPFQTPGPALSPAPSLRLNGAVLHYRPRYRSYPSIHWQHFVRVPDTNKLVCSCYRHSLSGSG